MSSVAGELREIHENIATLLAAKDEKEANGETERYGELKRNAWGNVRRAEKVLPGLIERVAELEGQADRTAALEAVAMDRQVPLRMLRGEPRTVSTPSVEDVADFEAALSASPTLADVHATYRHVVDYLRTIPAYHIPRSYLSDHADPMRKGKDETAISVALYVNDTSDASLPPQIRFEAINMKFMLVGDLFVRTTPKELPEMSEEAREVVGGIEAIVCGEGVRAEVAPAARHPRGWP